MVLVLFFSCAFLVVANGQPLDATQCPVYDNITAAMQAQYSNSFQIKKFNTTCLAASCPALTSAPCPYVSGSTDKSLNATAVGIVLAALSSCLQDQPSICSVPIRAFPSPCPFTIPIQAFLNSSVFTGNVTLMANTGFIFGFPSAIFTYDSSTGRYLINLTLNYVGQFEAYVGFQGMDRVLHLTNVSVKLSVNLGLEVTIDPANETDPVTLVSSSVTQSVQIGNAVTQNPNDQANVTTAAQTIANLNLAGSFVPETVATFVGTLMAYACLLAENNC